MPPGSNLYNIITLGQNESNFISTHATQNFLDISYIQEKQSISNALPDHVITIINGDIAFFTFHIAGCLVNRLAKFFISEIWSHPSPPISSELLVPSHDPVYHSLLSLYKYRNSVVR